MKTYTIKQGFSFNGLKIYKLNSVFGGFSVLCKCIKTDNYKFNKLELLKDIQFYLWKYSNNQRQIRIINILITQLENN